MTKQELDAKVVELQAKLDEQVHLAKAVEAKDKEIIELRRQVELLKVEAAEGNRAILEPLRQHVQSLQKELDEKRPLVDNAKLVKEEYEKLVQIANGYIVNFRNHLKAQQGSLDLAVELEAMLAEKLPKKQ